MTFLISCSRSIASFIATRTSFDLKSLESICIVIGEQFAWSALMILIALLLDWFLACRKEMKTISSTWPPSSALRRALSSTIVWNSSSST